MLLLFNTYACFACPRILDVLTLFNNQYIGSDIGFIHPNHITLKVLMRALIMWDEVEPTDEWVMNHLPENLSVSLYFFYIGSGTPGTLFIIAT